MQIFLVFMISLLCRLTSGGNDNQQYRDMLFSDKIKSVRLYKEGWNLSYPVMKLSGTDKLILCFDLLSDFPETFYYTIVHCDKDWNQSDIFITDYLDGFPENQIEEFRSSFNTTVNYIHYTLNLPNERTGLKLSGNYAVVVYPANQPDNPVLTKRFIVSEDNAVVNVNLRRPQMTADNDRGQQVDFTLTLKGTTINDPFMNIYTSILQNGRWDRAKFNLKADFAGNNELKYSSLSDKTIFQGGNEFRYFDIRSIRYKSEFIDRIDYQFPNYHILLQPSENREAKPYFYWQDFNGKYYVAVQEGQNHETDADYVWVYFTLPFRYPLTGGKVYVTGAFNEWNNNAGNLMTYNYEKEAYECSLLLKQGWYNFEYVFIGDKSGESSSEMFEGSHYETENDYLIIVYYRNPRDRYDRVVGSVVVNTLNRISG